jgi:hypothetical protein
MRWLVLGGLEHVFARLLVVFAVTFNLHELYPEVAVAAPSVNDGVLHMVNLGRTVTALSSGQDPTDAWVGTMVLGYPLFHYYQHLAYLVPAAVSALYTAIVRQELDPSNLLNWTSYLLLSLFPGSIYWSMRRFGFASLTSALAGIVAPLVATDGLFGFDLNSYVWIGYGLYTQLWGMFLLPLAIGQGYAALRDGRGYFWATLLIAATLMSHLVMGYIAVASLVSFAVLGGFGRWNPATTARAFLLRAGRLVLLVGLVAMLTSYFVVPFLLDGAYMARSVWEDPSKYNSLGHERILGMLLRGELFDYGRFPSLTLLAGLGLAVCVRRWREARYRVPLALFVLWLVLYFGRPTWGSLLDLLPLSREMQFHRLIAGVHLAGIFLIGIGLAVPWTWALARRDARYLLAPALLTALLLFPVYRERATYLSENARSMAASRTASTTEQQDISALIEWLRGAPPGRIYAGLAGTWGKDYRVGAIPVYALITQAGLDGFGRLYHALSLTGEIATLFDERRAEQYNLFDIRYVVAPRDRPMPDFLTPVRDFGRHRLYQVQTSGYFDLVGTSTTFVGGKSDFYPPAARWLASDEPRVKEHPTLVFGASSPDFQTSFPLAQAEALIPRNPMPPEPPRGQVVDERVESNAYTARVDVLRDSLLLLKATYHPNWHAFVDGVETPTVMLMPSYVGVPVAPGPHLVRLEYRPQTLRYILMLLGLLALLLTAAAEWRPRMLAKPFARLSRSPAAALTARLNWSPAAALAVRLNWYAVSRLVGRTVAAHPVNTWPGDAGQASRMAATIVAQAARVRISPWLARLGGVALAALLSGLPLLQLKLMSGHDARAQLPRTAELYAGLATGQLFPRWAPDLGAGHGEPLFNFYAPLFYYVSAAFHTVGFDLVGAEDLACFVLLLVAGLGMYQLASDFFGWRGGLVSAVAYLFAPYLLASLYVRHALSDFSAFAFIPLAIWGLHRFAEGGRCRFLAIGAVSTALVLLSSNPVALMTLPTLALLVVWLGGARRSLAMVLRGLWCLALGLGLAAFFWLPALMERDFVHVDRLLEGFLNYHNHFAYLYQLIYSPWGYGLSAPGPNDGMSFAIGPVHLTLAVAALLLRRVRAAYGRAGLMVSFFLVVVALAAFLSIYESTVVWDHLPLLQYFQFPWRFLSLIAVGTAFLCGFPFVLLQRADSRLVNGLMVGVIGALLLFNLPHARPESFLGVNDTDYSRQNIVARDIADTTAREYEPIWVSQRPETPAMERLSLLSGHGRVLDATLSDTEYAFRIDIADEARLRINTFYFPGWTLSVDGGPKPIDRSNPQGLMELSLEQGVHEVQVQFVDTPVRRWGANLSLLALLLLLATPWLAGIRLSATSLEPGTHSSARRPAPVWFHPRTARVLALPTVARPSVALIQSLARIVADHPLTDRQLRVLAYALFLCVSVAIVTTFRQYGLAWDEETIRQQGDAVMRWYTTFFRDRSALSFFDLYLYGGFFDIVAHLVSPFLPFGLYENRHLISAVFGLLCIILSYKVASSIAGHMAGLIAAAFLSLTPVFYGHMFVNPKDIPFATMFLLATYCLFRVYDALPRPPARLLIGTGFAIGFTLGVRVAGMFLFGCLAMLWIGWFSSELLFARQPTRRGLAGTIGWLAVAFASIAVVAWAAMLVCWPWAQTDPLLNPLKALGISAHYLWQGSVFFDGSTFRQDDIPVTYLPTWFAISLPEFYFIALPVGGLLAFRCAGHIKSDPSRFHMFVKLGLLVVLVSLPIAASMVLHAVVYDGIRLFMFVLPPLAVLAGVAVARLFRSSIRHPVKAVVGALIFLSACLTLSDMLRLHPYEYVYFNRLVAGGVQAASKRFETDYWGLSYKEGVDWLIENYRSNGQSRIRVANCSRPFLTGYYLETTPDARQRFIEVEPGADPQIFLATTRFDCQNLVRGNILHVVSRMGTPLLYVIEVHR